jgi:hypothetical protein
MGSWLKLRCGRGSGVAAAVAADSGLLFLPAAGQTPAQPKVLPYFSAAAAAATSGRGHIPIRTPTRYEALA